jgi:methylated-DNA-[protein]-cysteine S-methyltransferase
MPKSSAGMRGRVVIRRAPVPSDGIVFLSLPTPIGRMRLAATATGLVRVELPGTNAEARMNHWLAQHFPNAACRRGDSPILRKAAAQLEAYFTGSLRSFSLSAELAGTPFQLTVWRLVADIPFGDTRSYGDIARGIGNPNATRAVGAAQGANPLPIVIPCHRVLGTDGDLTGYGGGLATKHWLLEHERALAGGALPAPRPSPQLNLFPVRSAPAPRRWPAP